MCLHPEIGLLDLVNPQHEANSIRIMVQKCDKVDREDEADDNCRGYTHVPLKLRVYLSPVEMEHRQVLQRDNAGFTEDLKSVIDCILVWLYKGNVPEVEALEGVVGVQKGSASL